MLEGVVSSLLNQYLGAFLEGLDKDQFKISVWGGSVNLKDVKVKSGALDMLHLPLTVKYGYVQKLHLSADWRHLGSKPVIVELSGVYMVAVPSKGASIDSRAEMQAALESKLAKLQGLEDLRFSDEDADGGPAANSFMGRMATRILDNVQVVLKDIHVRYEDFEGPHAPTSFGVGLEELRAETTDERWQPTFSSEATLKTFKMINLKNLLVYMNVDDRANATASAVAAKLPAQHGRQASGAGALNPEGAGPDRRLSVSHLLSDSKITFLLRPVSGFLRMWMHKDAKSAPRVWIDSQISEISLQLSEAQYTEMLGLVNRISASHSSMAALLHTFQEHFREGTVAERREYVRLYKATLNAMWLAPLTDAQRQRKEQLEKELRYDDIRRYRLAAIAELKRELGIVSGPREVGVSAAAGPSSSSSSSKKESNVDKARSSIMLREQAAKLTTSFFGLKTKVIHPERELGEAEREAIYAGGVEGELVEVLEEVPPEFVHVQLKFALDTLSVTLSDRASKPLAVLAAEQTILHLTVRENSLSSIVTLGNIVMLDKCTEGTLYPAIIQDADRASKSVALSSASSSIQLQRQGSGSTAIAPGGHVLQVELHMPPLDASCDLRCAVRMKAPQIVIHQAFLSRMLEFFLPPSAIDWRALSTFDSGAAQELSTFSALSIPETVRLHRSIDVSLDIKAPTLVLPRDPTRPGTDVMVLDLGAVQVTSRVSKRSEQEALADRLAALSAEQLQQLPAANRSCLYDVRLISVKNVQCYLSSGSGLSGPASANVKPVYLLEPFHVSAEVHMALTADIHDLPDLRVLGNLPLIQLRLTPQTYTRVINLAATFESILDALSPTSPADTAQQQSLLSTSALQNAQQRLQKSIAPSPTRNVHDDLPQHAADTTLDLAALAKIMPTLEDAKKLMEQIDVNGDGTITRGEFREWMDRRHKSREHNQTLEVSFAIAAIVLSLSTDAISRGGNLAEVAGTQVMELRVEALQLNMRQHTHQLKLGLAIGVLSVADLLSKFETSKYLLNTRVSAPAVLPPGGASPAALTPHRPVPASFFSSAAAATLTDADFIRVELVTSSEQLASFAANPVDMALRVAFGPVLVCLEPSSLFRCGKFLFDVFVPAAAEVEESGRAAARSLTSPAPVRSPVQQQPSATPKPADASPPAAAASKEKRPRASRINIDVAVLFESLKVRLYSRQSPVAEAAIDSLHASFSLYSSGSVRVGLVLHQVWLRDCTEAGAKYAHIVSTRAGDEGDAAVSAKGAQEENALVRVHFDTFALSESDYPGHPAALTAAVRGIKVVFLQRFINELLFFFTMGPVGDLLAFLSANASSSSSSSAQSAQSNDLTATAAALSRDYAAMAAANYVHLAIELHRVDLVVPHHSASDEVLLARLDQVSVATALVDAPAGGEQHKFMQVMVRSSPFTVSTLIRAHGEEFKPLMQLAPSTLRIDLLSHLSRIAVALGTDGLDATLAPAQLHWTMALLELNLSEPATVVKAIPLRKSAAVRSRGISSPSPQLGSAQVLLSPPALGLASPAPVQAVEPAAKEAPAPDALVFQLEAHMKHLRFALTENHHVPAPVVGGVARGALAVFEMSTLFGGVQLRSNGGMEVAADCRGMSMIDVSEGGSHIRGRPILPIYKQLLLIVERPDELTPKAASKQKQQQPQPQDPSIAASDKRPLVFSLHKTVDSQGTGWTEVTLSVANFRFNVGPVLLRLPTFFAPPTTPASQAALAASEELARQSTQQQAVLLSAQSSAPKSTTVRAPSYLVFRLHVAEPVLQLVQDPTAEESDALLLTFGLSSEVLLSDNSQRSVLSADFHVTAFQCNSTRLNASQLGYVSVVDHSRVSGVVLAPFSVEGQVKLTTPHDALDAVRVLEPLDDPTQALSLPTLKAKVEIEPINVRISYQTYRLVLRTLNALSHATSEEAAKRSAFEAEAGQAAQADLEHIASVRDAQQASLPAGGLPMIHLGEKRDTAGSDGERSEVSAAQPLDATRVRDDDLDAPLVKHAVNALFHAEEISVSLRSLHVALINDSNCFDVPVARFSIDELTARVHGFAHQRQLTAQLKCRAECYNPSQLAWEPMLDHPWVVSVQGTQTHILSSVAFNRSLDALATPAQLAAEEALDPSLIALQAEHRDDIGVAYSGAVLSTRLTLSSPVPLALNVTHTMYHSLLATAKLFAVTAQDSEKEDEDGEQGASQRQLRASTSLLKDARASSADTSASAPSAMARSMMVTQEFHRFRFENCTEFGVAITPQAMRRRRTGSGSSGSQAQAAGEAAASQPAVLSLPAYSTLPFDFPPDLPLSESALNVELKRSGEGDSVASVSFTASMRSSATQSFVLPVGGQGQDAQKVRLLFEMAIVDGIKVCRLRGVIGLRNSTTFALEVRATAAASDGQAHADFPLLPPGATWWLPLVPLHDSGGFLLSLRPRNTGARAQGFVNSDFSWSSPFICLGDYSSQHQYLSCVHQTGVSGSATTVGAHGDRPSAPASPVVGADGDFSAAVSIVHSWEHSGISAVTADEAQGEAGLRGGRPFTAQIYDVSAAMLVQNVLAADVDMRIVERTAQRREVVHWSAEVKQGTTQPVHMLLNAKPVYVQLRIPSLQTEWSELMALPSVPPQGHSMGTYGLSLLDTTGRELRVLLEVHLQGTTRIVLYVPFWVQDLTGCGLILSADTKSTVPLGPFADFRARMTSDARRPVMFNFPAGHKGSKDVRLSTMDSVARASSWSDVRWSAPISIDRLGMESSTSIVGPPQLLPGESEAWLRTLSDVSVSVTQAEGKYRRTKLVRLQPHYIFVNNLGCDLEFTQRISTNPSLVHSRKGSVPPFVLRAGGQQEFHWPDHAANRSIILRRAGSEFADWRWSGEIDPSSLGDLSIAVRHKSDPSRCWFFRCAIHVQNATVFVVFSEYDQAQLHALLPYSIQNRCPHQPIRVRQLVPAKGTPECTIPVGQCDWLSVPSYSLLHFAPEVGIYSRPCLLEVQMGLSVAANGSVQAERTVVINLDDVKPQGKVTVSPLAGDDLGKGQTVHLWTESNGASTTLKLSNFPSADQFAAEITQAEKGLTTKQVILRQRERRWAELRHMQDANNARITALQRRMDAAVPSTAGASSASASSNPSTPLRATLESQLSEKHRIASAIKSEMSSMQRRQMIDSKGAALPVRLQQDVEFVVQLQSVEGLASALKAMNNTGDIVCRIRSELTGKTAAVVLQRYVPQNQEEQGQQAAAAAAASAAPAHPAAGGSGSSGSFVAPAWSPTVRLHVPEEMLAAHDEVLHLAVFFQPIDTTTGSNDTPSPSAAPLVATPAASDAPEQTQELLQHPSFRKATRLRAHLPPIPLAHVALPLNNVPITGTPAFAASQSAKKDPRTINWRHQRLPLQSDLFSDGAVFATLSVERLPARSEEARSQLRVEALVPQVSLSLVDSTPQEILFFTLSNLSAIFDDTLSTQGVELKLGALQLDNQCVDALFPIILGFAPVEANERQPVLQLSIAKRKTRLPVLLFDYASLLLQQLDVKVEEQMIYTLLRFASGFREGDDGQDDDDEEDAETRSALEMRVSDYFTVQKGQQRQSAESLLWFNVLQVQPIALNLSFEAAPGMRTRMSGSKWNPIDMLLSFAGTALASINSAPIRLNGLTFEHVRGSPTVILGNLLHHYRGEIIGETYKVVGALEFLGNPIGAVNKLGTGVSDFFYLPAKGAVESPNAFVEGLAKGSLSLVRGTLSGVLNTAGSITGSISKGLAMASMDDAFIAKQASKQQEAPKHAADGLFKGGKSLAGGLFKGITGLVTDPYKGAQKEGLFGFGKGLARGLAGVVAKPTSGAIAFASQTLHGVGNTADYLTSTAVRPTHVRPQRYIAPQAGLAPYDRPLAEQHEASEKARLKRIRKGKEDGAK